LFGVIWTQAHGWDGANRGYHEKTTDVLARWAMRVARAGLKPARAAIFAPIPFGLEILLGVREVVFLGGDGLPAALAADEDIGEECFRERGAGGVGCGEDASGDGYVAVEGDAQLGEMLFGSALVGKGMRAQVGHHFRFCDELAVCGIGADEIAGEDIVEFRCVAGALRVQPAVLELDDLRVFHVERGGGLLRSSRGLRESGGGENECGEESGNAFGGRAIGNL